ncbi:MAG: sigma 54-interacting transcriptional regulator [Megasphaera sp.]|jgi:transcriptional regulator with PAS, ATPase and Fis domain|nr:sigma 54-interacting transcriptional regulator [Megasphaera sp.]
MVSEQDWNTFMETGEASTTIPPIIVQSWNYCRSIKLNPLKGYSQEVVTGKAFEEIISHNSELLKIAIPFVQRLFMEMKDFKNSSFIGVLSDKDGYILKTILPAHGTDLSHSLYYSEGLRQTEELIGTSAISLVQKTLKPLQVAGFEHYCKIHHNTSCSAAPIIDASGELVGVFSLAGPKDKVNSHTLGMVIATASAISNLMKADQANSTLSEKTNMYMTILDSMNDGLIMLNAKGIVQYINPFGAKTLHIDRRKAINKPIDSLVDFDPIIMHALRSGVGYTDREFFIETKRGTLDFVKTAIILKDDDGMTTGAIDIFREIKRVKDLINKITGATAKFTFDDILGNDSALLEAIRMAKIAANGNANVLIQGESGTGKELIAQSIHQASARHDGPFIAINCGAIPRNLVESELFGYEGGAFTGAKSNGQAGKFELAHGGTIFLDEIGDMPLEIQVQLLRVLQEQRIMRIGGTRYIDIDVRVLAATNKDLAEGVANGNFRADLYYRLNVLPITLPPLRERHSDIVLLINMLLENKCQRLDIKTKHFDQESFDIMQKYTWPGNIRELENVVERMIYTCPHEVITKDFLPANMKKQDSPPPSWLGENMTLKEFEHRYIMQVYEQCDKNISQTAKSLNIGRNTLYSKLKEVDENILVENN